MTQWDGEFTKRRRKYPLHNNNWHKSGYKTDKMGLICQSDEMRLIIESGSIVTAELAKDGFFVVSLPKPHLRWCLYSHTTTGWNKDVSAFVDMYRRFQECVRKNCNSNDYHAFRLRLLIKNDSRIIKEWYQVNTAIDKALEQEKNK